jgi:uncharacterized protein YjbI with pentapeptide repeats
MLNIYDTSIDLDFYKDSKYFREITYKLFNLSNPNIDNPYINKTNIDNPYINKTNIDNPYINKTNIDNPYINKTNINKTNIDKTNIDKTHIDKTHIDKTHIDKTNIYETYIDKTNIDKTNIDKTNIYETYIDKTNIDKTNIDKTNIDKTNIDKSDMYKPANIYETYIDKIDMYKPANIYKTNIDRNNINNKYCKKNINKYIIIDIKKSYIYNIWNDNLLKIIDNDIIISLFTIDEFKKYYIMDYEDNVIKTGKKFINFPLNKKSQCAHINVVQSICKNIQCGILSPFEDMKRIILIINKYIKNNNRILLHCNHDYQRLTVFLTCVMLVNNYEIDYVLKIIDKYNIKELYKNYIIDFFNYIKN